MDNFETIIISIIFFLCIISGIIAFAVVTSREKKSNSKTYKSQQSNSNYNPVAYDHDSSESGGDD